MVCSRRKPGQKYPIWHNVFPIHVLRSSNIKGRERTRDREPHSRVREVLTRAYPRAGFFFFHQQSDQIRKNRTRGFVSDLPSSEPKNDGAGIIRAKVVVCLPFFVFRMHI